MTEFPTPYPGSSVQGAPSYPGLADNWGLHGGGRARGGASGCGQCGCGGGQRQRRREWRSRHEGRVDWMTTATTIRRVFLTGETPAPGRLAGASGAGAERQGGLPTPGAPLGDASISSARTRGAQKQVWGQHCRLDEALPNRRVSPPPPQPSPVRGVATPPATTGKQTHQRRRTVTCAHSACPWVPMGERSWCRPRPTARFDASRRRRLPASGCWGGPR